METWCSYIILINIDRNRLVVGRFCHNITYLSTTNLFIPVTVNYRFFLDTVHLFAINYFFPFPIVAYSKYGKVA